MKKALVIFIVVLGTALGSCLAGATEITLFEWKTLGSGINFAAFDTATGLGTVTMTIAGTGSKQAGLYVDHEIDENLNTFYNEYGGVNGTPASGLSWEIDEPGFVYGDIYDNFTSSPAFLDNANGVPVTAPDDVSMALLWDFTLASGETAYLKFMIGTAVPAGGFYLVQTDPDSQASIYFNSALRIEGGGSGQENIPEPSTVMLLSAGLVGLALYSRRRFIR